MGIFSKLFGKKDSHPQPSHAADIENAGNTTPAYKEPKADPSPKKAAPQAPPITFISRVSAEHRGDRFEPEIPALQGDYAKAVFLNAYAKASPIKAQKDYQAYFLYECGIRDCPAYHRALVDEGYLAESSVADIVRAQKVADLKPVLAELGQPVSGKKEALVERLLSSADEGFLRAKFSARTYAITEKGKQFLADHAAYVKLHQHKTWGISWQEFDENRCPGLSDNDIIWRILNKRVATSPAFGRNDYLFMYQLLVEERKRKDAIAMLLRVVYIDVSGVEGLDTIGLYRTKAISLKQAREFFDVAVMLAPGVIGDIEEYTDVYEDTIVDRIFEWKLPINLCDKATFLDLVHSCMKGTFDEEKFLSKLRRAYNKVLREVGPA